MGRTTFKAEIVKIDELHPHPRNYRNHPDDQIAHLIESLKEHGFYRNIVVAREGTILAGHGMVEAARKMALDTVPVIRLDLDPTDALALKVLTGDNETTRLSESDDRLLTELLREIKEADEAGLLGTGFDEQMLAALVLVTRPAAEVATFNEAAEWVGMPEYVPEHQPLKMVVSFRNEEDRAEFARRLDLSITKTTKSVWWPQRDREDLSSILRCAANQESRSRPASMSSA